MRNRFCVFAVVFACLFCGAASAAVDVFLKLEGIPGESMDSRHAGEIDVTAIEHSLGTASNAPPRLSTGLKPSLPVAAPASRSVGPITLTKFVDIASPQLMTKCSTQDKIPTAVLVVRKAGAKPIEFLKATMQGVTVSSYQFNVGTATERPLETITLSFDSIEWQYVQMKADGTTGASVSATYSGR